MMRSRPSRTSDVHERQVGQPRTNQVQAREAVAGGPGKPMRRVEVPREQQFAGTDLAPLFPLVREHVTEMLQPRWTFYRQYFSDDSLSGHYYGGVGPEAQPVGDPDQCDAAPAGRIIRPRHGPDRCRRSSGPTGCRR